MTTTLVTVFHNGAEIVSFRAASDKVDLIVVESGALRVSNIEEGWSRVYAPGEWSEVRTLHER